MSVVLPEGWTVTTLDNIAEWGSGGTPSRKNAEYYGGDIPWIKTGDLGKKLLNQASEFITEEAVKNSSAKFFPKGSVIMAMYGATIGKTSILGIDATTNQACGVGQPVRGGTTTEFLYYLLVNEKDKFIAKGKGGAQPNISQALIKAHEIVLPPLAEQKQIAIKLDKLLAQVDTIKKRIDSVPVILKRFRQSVLSAAVSGKITEEWRKTNNICELSLKKVGEYIELAYGKSLPAKQRSGNGFPVFGSNGEVGRHKDYIVDGPFIIIGRKGSNGIVTWSEESGWPIDTAYYVKVNEEKIQLKFSYYMLQTLGLTELNRSTAIPGLNRDDAYDCGFLLPSLKDQTEIVSRIEHFFIFAYQIEQHVKNAQIRVNNLRKIILKKAFRGELTTEWRKENPKLISGGNSAESLLKQIQIEGDVVDAKLKGKRSSTHKARKKKESKVESDLLTKETPKKSKDISSVPTLHVSSKDKPLTLSKRALELLDVIRDKIGVNTFEVEELIKYVTLSYDELKETLFELIKGDRQAGLKPELEMQWNGYYQLRVINKL